MRFLSIILAGGIGTTGRALMIVTSSSKCGEAGRGGAIGTTIRVLFISWFGLIVISTAEEFDDAPELGCGFAATRFRMSA